MMTLKRTYAIKIITGKNNTLYISVLRMYDLGYSFQSTKNIKKSTNWKNKKSVENIVKKLNNGQFQPGFDKEQNSKYKYDVVEVTPIKLSRLLKLKKIIKKS